MTTYSWMYYNTTSGFLAPQHSTHSPLISTVTTTVTPTSGQATTSTSSNTGVTLPIGTTTTTSEQKDSETDVVVSTTAITTEVTFDPTLIPAGNALVGIYNDGDYPMPSDFQTAFETPDAWLYQNGTFVANPAYNANAIALAQAISAQSALIDAGYAQTMSAGFTSNADGTLRTYPADQGTISELLMLRSVILANEFPASGVSVLDAQGNHYTFTQSQCSQLITDAQNFYMGNRNQRLQLLSQIQQATTVSAVQAITWTPASYTPQPAPTS